MKKGIYLDNASATPLDESVFAAMQPFFAGLFYNPSADYDPARKVRQALESARSLAAQTIGAKPAEIIFTAGATEANNLAVHGIMRRFMKAKAAISAIEHESVRGPASRYNLAIIPVDKHGLVDSESAEQYISNQTVLVSVMYANNEVGTIQPIRKIAAKLEMIRRQRQKAGNKLPLYFHVDGAQAGNYLDMHVHRLGVDMLTINGGKIYGPKQSGVLYVKTGVELLPLLQGGGQERGLRGGTENVAGVVGLAAALQAADAKRHEESIRTVALRNQLETGILKIAPNAFVNGSLKHRLPNNLHITFPGYDNERLLMELDERGIYAAAGSACSASTDEPSHVLNAMGLSESSIRSSIRFSLGRRTTEAQIKAVLEKLANIL